MSELQLFQVWLVGEGNAAPAEPLLPPFMHLDVLWWEVWCAGIQVNWKQCLVVWGWLSSQGVSAKAQMDAAPCRQEIQTSVCVSFGPAAFSL